MRFVDTVNDRFIAEVENTAPTLTSSSPALGVGVSVSLVAERRNEPHTVPGRDAV